MKKHNLLRLSGAIALALGISSTAIANTTSSSIRGQVTGPQGNAAAGTTVTITHVPSGTTRTVTVSSEGYFAAQGLRVGGPYKIDIDSDKFEDATVNDVFLQLGDTYPLAVSLEELQDSETIVVTGRQMISPFSGGTGPSSHFGAEALDNAPTISRDIKDLVRLDPRVYIDESRSDAIQCGGNSPRFNSITLDGVRMNDNFGLNSNGYPTERMPFSYASIDQVSVELAPFDVMYGGFTACNINAVTRSGGNEFKGNVFYDYSKDTWKGEEVRGDSIPNGDYTESRYGFDVGGPIIKDELFFYVSYEYLEEANLFNYPSGPEEIGGTNQVSLDDIARVRQIANDVYGYDIGDYPSSATVEDEKLLVKLDWNINENHRASFVYNWNDGFNLSQSDGFAMTFDSHFYERGAELESMVASVYSTWSENFETELRVGNITLDNRQQSLDAASGFGEVQIRNNGTTIYLGPDDSRQSNDLDWEADTLKFSGTYFMDQHKITAGVEYEELDVFNLFMQQTQGEFRFDSIDDFESGDFARIYYNNSSGTNDPNDNAASFSYALQTFYIQDEYTFTDYDMNLTFGLRYDRYTSSDNPTENPNFEALYGFTNTKNLDGIDLLQPRIGFNWVVDDQLEVRAGAGLYSGGNPNVWVSNAYSNDGVTQIAVREFMVGLSGANLFTTPMVNGGAPLFEVPQAMYDYVQNLPVGGGNSATNAIDPNFEIPAEWKYSIGATYTTDDNWVFVADLLHNEKQDSAIVYDAGVTYDGGATFDGRPTYERTAGRTGDFVLSNVRGADGSSTILSLAASKNFDNGVSLRLAYSTIDAEDVSPMTSSVAGSNYSNIAVTDAIMPGVARTDYEIKDRITADLGYKVEWWEGYPTRFNLYAQYSDGKPFSYVFDSSDREWGDENWNGSRQLLYIPTENDANVVYDAGFDLDAFNAFIEANGLRRGSILARNQFTADSWFKMDLRISQDIPGVLGAERGNVYFVVRNLGNLLNDDWGTLRTGPFVGGRLVEMDVDSQGRYVYEDFNERNTEQSVFRDASLWEMRLGVKFSF